MPSETRRGAGSRIVIGTVSRGGDATTQAEKVELAADIKDVYAEAKSAGFSVKAIRAVVKVRRQDKQERDAKQVIGDILRCRCLIGDAAHVFHA